MMICYILRLRSGFENWQTKLHLLRSASVATKIRFLTSNSEESGIHQVSRCSFPILMARDLAIDTFHFSVKLCAYAMHSTRFKCAPYDEQPLIAISYLDDLVINTPVKSTFGCFKIFGQVGTLASWCSTVDRNICSFWWNYIQIT